jgi:uncharacterized protein
MKLAVISDIHENIHNLIMFLDVVEKHNVEKIIFLGDFINNGIAKTLASSEIPVFAIWGNNDGDKVAITKTSLMEKSNLTVGFDTFDFLEFDNRKIFLTHYPVLAKPMAKSGDFDAVFYGHDHIANLDKINGCIIVNPGEISAHKKGEATFAIYDAETNTAELFTIEGSVSLLTKESETYFKKIGFGYSKSKTHEY